MEAFDCAVVITDHRRSTMSSSRSTTRRSRCLMSRTHDVLIAAILTLLAAASAAAFVGPSATIVGTVTLTAANGDALFGDAVRVTLVCAADGATRTEVSDEHGAYRFLNVPVDSCSIEADVQGFVAQPVRVVTAADQVVGTDLHLGIASLRVGVNVGGTEPRELKVPRRSCRPDAGRRFERSAKVCTR
jgi:hypothetical protein